MMSANNSLIHKPTVICSTDKDLRTVPSLNYNISTKLLQTITPDIANYNFWKQILIGDSTDNIPSPYGLGEMGAEEWLDKVKGDEDMDYYLSILPFYKSFLHRTDKKGNLKTKWYQSLLERRESTDGVAEEIILEVGNLLWMHRTLDKEERWKLPI